VHNLDSATLVLLPVQMRNHLLLLCANTQVHFCFRKKRKLGKVLWLWFRFL